AACDAQHEGAAVPAHQQTAQEEPARLAGLLAPRQPAGAVARQARPDTLELFPVDECRMTVRYDNRLRVRPVDALAASRLRGRAALESPSLALGVDAPRLVAEVGAVRQDAVDGHARPPGVARGTRDAASEQLFGHLRDRPPLVVQGEDEAHHVRLPFVRNVN